MKLSCNNHVASFTAEEAMNPEHDFTPAISMEAANIPAGEYTFVYDYPLSREARFVHALIPSMSWIDVLLLAKADYEKIYADEDAAAGKTGNIPGMLNRQSSSGPYGIWGHHIDDLYFEGVQIDVKKRQVEFSIGS